VGSPVVWGCGVGWTGRANTEDSAVDWKVPVPRDVSIDHEFYFTDTKNGGTKKKKKDSQGQTGVCVCVCMYVCMRVRRREGNKATCSFSLFFNFRK
jgi:hypothetical protein